MVYSACRRGFKALSAVSPVALIVGLVVASLIWALIKSVLGKRVAMESEYSHGTRRLNCREFLTTVLDNCWSGGLGLATVRWAP